MRSVKFSLELHTIKNDETNCCGANYTDEEHNVIGPMKMEHSLRWVFIHDCMSELFLHLWNKLPKKSKRHSNELFCRWK